MREAIGGSMLLYIIIPIIFLFIVFIAFIMNYASAYRSANYVITQIETCNGDLNNCDHTSYNGIKDEILKKYHYNDKIDITCKTNSLGAIYRVSLNVTFELPMIGKVGVYKVNSETKTLYGASCH